MSKRILVVDDDLDIQEQMKTILESNDFECILAGNVKEAEEKLNTESIDLIQLDVMMDNDSDGFNLAQRLKVDEKLKQIPIIMVTSVNQHSNFKFSKETDGNFIPAEKFIEKPIDPKKLIDTIQELL